MDGSYLSNAAIVEASRQFVCIRLVTYEDKAEANFMKSVFSSASGLFENTTFGILSPDGKQNLVRSGRGPMHSFRSSAEMANRMKRIAGRYAGAPFASLSDKQLPLTESVDIGLNVAACDNLPLVISFATEQRMIDELNAKLIELAWREQWAGQFIFAVARSSKQLKPISDADKEPGILFVEPGQYGLSGKVLTRIDVDADTKQTETAFASAIDKFSRQPASPNAHIKLGIQLGLDWESEIPETDLQSLRAKERSRGTR